MQSGRKLDSKINTTGKKKLTNSRRKITLVSIRKKRGFFSIVLLLLTGIFIFLRHFVSFYFILGLMTARM